MSETYMGRSEEGLTVEVPPCLGSPHPPLCSAEQTLRRALEIRSRLLEDDDPALVTTRGILASVLQRLGRVEEVRGPC